MSFSSDRASSVQHWKWTDDHDLASIGQPRFQVDSDSELMLFA